GGTRTIRARLREPRALRPWHDDDARNRDAISANGLRHGRTLDHHERHVDGSLRRLRHQDDLERHRFSVAYAELIPARRTQETQRSSTMRRLITIAATTAVLVGLQTSSASALKILIPDGAVSFTVNVTGTPNPYQLHLTADDFGSGSNDELDI